MHRPAQAVEMRACERVSVWVRQTSSTACMHASCRLPTIGKVQAQREERLIGWRGRRRDVEDSASFWPLIGLAAMHHHHIHLIHWLMHVQTGKVRACPSITMLVRVVGGEPDLLPRASFLLELAKLVLEESF